MKKDFSLPDIVRDCNDDKVKKVIEEIKHSEKRFGKILQSIIKNLYRPCYHRKDLFTYDDITAIFCNLETLSALQVQFCEELDSISDITMLTSCFCHWLPIMAPVYDRYCSNFSYAIKRLQAKDKKTVNYNNHLLLERKENSRSRHSRSRSSEYSDHPNSENIVASMSINWLELCNSKQALFLEGCRVKSQMPNLPVGAFLLEPVQRITRYPLLLKTLWHELMKVMDYDEKIFDLQQLQIIMTLSENVAQVANNRDQRKRWNFSPVRMNLKNDQNLKRIRAFNIMRIFNRH